MAITEEQIPIDGETYRFRNKDGNVELVLPSRTTHNSLIDPDEHKVPDVWIVTRTNGDILFALQGDEGRGFYTCTAQRLYNVHKVQWFEPLADNYRKLLWVNHNEYIQSAYRWFTWEEIRDFAFVDRFAVNYHKWMPGDWKFVSEGANGFLLVMVDNDPYWADAIGQIPYAVDTYRARQSIKQVIDIGVRFGDGCTVTAVFSEGDTSNEYDNFMVLRGALYARRSFTYHKEKAGFFSLSEEELVETQHDIPASELAKPITEDEFRRYGTWNK